MENNPEKTTEEKLEEILYKYFPEAEGQVNIEAINIFDDILSAMKAAYNLRGEEDKKAMEKVFVFDDKYHSSDWISGYHSASRDAIGSITKNDIK